jgi:hypothetical protein
LCEPDPFNILWVCCSSTAKYHTLLHYNPGIASYIGEPNSPGHLNETDHSNHSCTPQNPNAHHPTFPHFHTTHANSDRMHEGRWQCGGI